MTDGLGMHYVTSFLIDMQKINNLYGWEMSPKLPVNRFK